jgi:quinol monooxygenase YgiN
MVSFIVRFRFTQEDRAEMAELARLLAVETRKEPGCLTYLPFHLEDDLDTLLIMEQYADEKALAAHREADHFKKWCVGGLYQKMKERTIENLFSLG